jgi:hypothetical protein
MPVSTIDHALIYPNIPTLTGPRCYGTWAHPLTSGPHRDVLSFTTPPRDATRRARHVSSIRATTPPTFPDLPPILIPHTSHLSPTDGRAHTGGGPTCKKKSREGHGGPGVFTAQRFESERDKIGKKKKKERKKEEKISRRGSHAFLFFPPLLSPPPRGVCLSLSRARSLPPQAKSRRARARKLLEASALA